MPACSQTRVISPPTPITGTIASPHSPALATCSFLASFNMNRRQSQLSTAVPALGWTLVATLAILARMVDASARGEMGVLNEASKVAQAESQGRQLLGEPWTDWKKGAKVTMDRYLALGSAYELQEELSMVVGVHLVHVPGTDQYLFMERPSGYHPDGEPSIAGYYDLAENGKWKHVESPDGLFCAGHTIMSDGKLVIVGGHQQNAGWPSGIQSLRIYTPGDDKLVKVGEMLYPRWYPTATLLPNKNIMIMGGTQGVGAGTKNVPVYEIWDMNDESHMSVTSLDVDTKYLDRARQNYYPFNYVMPSGDLFNFCGRFGTILEPNSGTYLIDMPRRFGYASAQFPFTGTSVMLALLPENDYAVEVVVFGGATESATNNLDKKAGSESHRIAVYPPTQEKPTYSFSDWDQEEMGEARVMGDATILPNGMVVVLNGAQTGLAGDSSSGGDTRANNPTLRAVLYNPYSSKGARYNTLAQSRIARMYHSVAALTTNGTILVAGCDRCNPWLLESDMEIDLPDSKAEYRVEIFYPPFWYDMENKPRLVYWPEAVIYGQEFMVAYTGEMKQGSEVTQAVLVAPSATTHSFNQNQRVVGLVIKHSDTDGQILTLVAPPTANHAPPQKYMLFLLNGHTYSRAQWVHLS